MRGGGVLFCDIRGGGGLSAQAATLIAFVAYLAIVGVVVVWAMLRRTKDLGDFFLGGRRMNEWVVALSAVASGRSSWLVVGLSGYAYMFGVAAVWAALGYIVVEMFQFVFLGKRLRRYTHNRNIITVPAFLSERLGDRRKVLIWASSLVITFLFFLYVSAQMVGGGKAVSGAFGVSLTVGVLVTAAIVGVYTVLGGFVAVSLTDVVQACFMIVALVVLPVVAVLKAGGVGALLAKLASDEHIRLFAQHGIKYNPVDVFCFGVVTALGMVGIGLGSPGNPHILVRYMSIKRTAFLRKCMLVGTIWNVVMAWGAIFAGLAARFFVTPAEISVHGHLDRELAFSALARLHLGPVLLGLVTAAVIAAVMSTVDSQLLVISSCITEDIGRRALGKGGGGRRLVFVARLVVGILVVCALLTGLAARGSSVFNFVLVAWSGLGAAFGPIVILALYWRRLSWQGALASIVVGPFVTLFWKGMGWSKNVIYELVPAFGAAFCAALIVSLLTKPPTDVETHMQDMLKEKVQRKAQKEASE